MQAQWQGKSVLITGAGSGIGRALSLEFARRGAMVYVTALTEAEAQRVVDEILALGYRAVAVRLDVTDNAQYLATLERVAREQDGLDVLVNNAGSLYVGEYVEMDEACLEQLIRVNLTAVAIGTLYACRIMKAQGHGLIVNVASQGGLMPVGSMAAYSATKHGVVGLTASVGGEAEAFGVHLKAVCPGNVASEMLNKATTRGIDADGVLAMLPRAISAQQAAATIVDGLAGRKRRIILPGYSKVLTLIARLWPGFGHRGAVHSMGRFRDRRNDSLNQH